MRVKRKCRILSILLCIAVLMSFSFTLAFAESEETVEASDPVSVEMKIVSSASSEQTDTAEKSIQKIEEITDEADAEVSENQNDIKVISKDSFFIDGEPGYEDDYIDWNSDNDFILYKGDDLQLDFFMYDTWKDHNTIPAFDIWSADGEDPVFTYNPADSGLIVTADNWDKFTGQIDIGSGDLEPGEYFIAIQAMPCDADGVWVEDLSGFEIPEEYVDFVIKECP